jgi:hypothetical protein
MLLPNARVVGGLMSSVSLKSRLENHVVVLFLSALVGGFGAGIGAYKALLSISGQVVVSSDTLDRTKDEASQCKEQLTALEANHRASVAPEKSSEPTHISFESTTSGDHSPINNSVGAAK